VSKTAWAAVIVLLVVASEVADLIWSELPLEALSLCSIVCIEGGDGECTIDVADEVVVTR